MDSGIYGAIDASINRAMEGLRVCEDICRFTLRHNGLSTKIKEIRNDLNSSLKLFPRVNLISGRDVENDSIKFLDTGSEKNRKDISEIAASNIHRATEALRSVEEFFKLAYPDQNDNPFQRIRFAVYSFEKEITAVLLRKEKLHFFDSSLYAILDSSFVKNADYLGTARRFVDGGASIIQLRMKNSPMGEILKTAKDVSRICRDNNVLFIVNDFTEIAYLSGADGVHLGQDDIPVSEARRVLPVDAIVGISTHSVEQAQAAALNEPDYIAIGPVYDTATKNNELLKGLGENVVKKVISSISVPVIAIGGLNPERIGSLSSKGCRCFAVVSYLYNNDTIEENCRNIKKFFESTKSDK